MPVAELGAAQIADRGRHAIGRHVFEDRLLEDRLVDGPAHRDVFVLLAFGDHRWSPLRLRYGIGFPTVTQEPRVSPDIKRELA